jgi:hypothetical protein
LCRVEEGRKTAELVLARLIVQSADGQADPAPLALAGRPAVTVAQVYDDFLDAKKVECSEHTFAWYRDKLDPFFVRFGNRPIASLAYQDGLSYKKWLMDEKAWKKGKSEMRGLGNTSVNHHVRAAKTLLEWACKPSRRHKYGLAVNEWQEIGPLTERPRERLITDE